MPISLAPLSLAALLAAEAPAELMGRTWDAAVATRDALRAYPDPPAAGFDDLDPAALAEPAW